MADSNSWNDRYRGDRPPWDSGEVCPHLVAFLRERGLARIRVLDVGCGTGTNAVWLAQQGHAVTAVDIAPLAIERARASAAQAGVTAEFAVKDVLRDALDGEYDLVFDRGVWHVFDRPDDRARFAEVVAAHLAPGGRWLSVSGSTEGAPRETGPPRRSAREIALAVEPHLAIEEIRETTFGEGGQWPDPAPAWRWVAARRAAPAQRSTGS